MQFLPLTNGIAHAPRSRRQRKASNRILSIGIGICLISLCVSYAFAHHDTVTRDNKAWLSEQLEHDCYHLASDITYAMRQMLGEWTEGQLLDVAQQKADIYEAMCK